MGSKSFLKVCAATFLYALVHSGLASKKAKRAAEKVFGGRCRNALYRPFYLVQSAATMVVLVAYVRRLPGAMLWEFRGTAAVPFRLGQVAGVGWATYAAYEVGLSEILGLRGLIQLLRGESQIAKEPEAQGPAPGNAGELRVRGPFRLSRHPLNLAPLIVMWLNPRMTNKLLAYNVVATPYLVIGSWLEEHRLLAAYGDEYRAYRESDIAFYLPGRLTEGKP